MATRPQLATDRHEGEHVAQRPGGAEDDRAHVVTRPPAHAIAEHPTPGVRAAGPPGRRSGHPVLLLAGGHRRQASPVTPWVPVDPRLPRNGWLLRSKTPPSSATSTYPSPLSATARSARSAPAWSPSRGRARPRRRRRPPSTAASQYPRPSGGTATPTIGAASGNAAADPRNDASPRAKTPPSVAARRSPSPLGVATAATIGSVQRCAVDAPEIGGRAVGDDCAVGRDRPVAVGGVPDEPRRHRRPGRCPARWRPRTRRRRRRRRAPSTRRPTACARARRVWPTGARGDRRAVTRRRSRGRRRPGRRAGTHAAPAPAWGPVVRAAPGEAARRRRRRS